MFCQAHHIKFEHLKSIHCFDLFVYLCFTLEQKIQWILIGKNTFNFLMHGNVLLKYTHFFKSVHLQYMHVLLHISAHITKQDLQK